MTEILSMVVSHALAFLAGAFMAMGLLKQFFFKRQSYLSNRLTGQDLHIQNQQTAINELRRLLIDKYGPREEWP